MLSRQDRDALDFLRDTTINVGIDTYYGYNFNNPVGRVNLLRAYDVLSNEFSLNQASVIFDHPPDVDAGRRWGGRFDLQFGQATDTLQGNPSNEPRPAICNICLVRSVKQMSFKSRWFFFAVIHSPTIVPSPELSR